MTAITLNLLADEQLTLQRRARDPFKVAIAIGVVLVTIVVGLGVLVSTLADKKQSEAEKLKSDYEAMGESAIAEREVRYRWTESLSKDIITINTKRILFAPHLALVKDVIPATVQLANISLAVSTDSPQLVPPAPESLGDENTKPKRTVRPAKTERLVLRLEGRATSSRPELEVDEFMQALRSDETFSKLVHEIQLRSIARATLADPLTGAPQGASAFFVIECTFKEAL